MIANTPSGNSQGDTKMATKNHKVRILSFDPGLSHTGYIFSEYNLDDDRLVILKMDEIHPGPVVDRAQYRDEVNKFDKRTVSLAYLREQITKLLMEFKPDMTCSEDIFINPRRPTAYGALCMWVATARMVCRDIAGKYLVTIPTKICKAELTKSGSSDKLTVQQCVAASNRIIFKDPTMLTQMTEHEADSIAVANAFVVRYRDLIEQYVEERNGK